MLTRVCPYSRRPLQQIVNGSISSTWSRPAPSPRRQIGNNASRLSPLLLHWSLIIELLDTSWILISDNQLPSNKSISLCLLETFCPIRNNPLRQWVSPERPGEGSDLTLRESWISWTGFVCIRSVYMPLWLQWFCHIHTGDVHLSLVSFISVCFSAAGGILLVYKVTS